jgi:hypothetical protein
MICGSDAIRCLLSCARGPGIGSRVLYSGDVDCPILLLVLDAPNMRIPSRSSGCKIT